MQKPDLLKPVFDVFPEAKEAVEENKCPLCKETIRLLDFRDESSCREYAISGMCQKCQDEVFNED